MESGLNTWVRGCVWTKNSNALGLRVDLLAEVFIDTTKVGQGQLSRFDAAIGDGPATDFLLRTGRALNLTAGSSTWSTTTSPGRDGSGIRADRPAARGRRRRAVRRAAIAIASVFSSDQRQREARDRRRPAARAR